MSDVWKFPSTPHLAWLAKSALRADKLLSPLEVNCFFSGEIVIEEKIDGANLGLSFDARGHLRFQNRGDWVDGRFSGQWKLLRGWASKHEAALHDVLPQNHVLFGEWCYAVHSVRYDRLPDWYLAFDVYDPKVRRFWSTRRRDALLTAAQIEQVPRISRGRFALEDFKQILKGRSAFGPSMREGLYLRIEDDGWLLNRAKLVNPEFTQAIARHWSKKPLESNALSPLEGRE